MDRSSTASPATLPPKTTSFVDRRVERQRTRALLGQTRLVTITGTGGVGKTRLAIEVAREVFRTFDDVWFVDLGPIASSGSVPDAVASGIGLQSLGTDFAADLADYLHRRRALLILDGCEHVLTGTAELVLVLLRSCPDLRIIATSRAPLRLVQETVLTIGTLSTSPRSAGLGRPSRPPPSSSSSIAPRMSTTRSI
jgi:predicted ATPase